MMALVECMSRAYRSLLLTLINYYAHVVADAGCDGVRLRFA